MENLKEKYRKLENETIDEYKLRMYDYRDEFSSWEQLANVANQALGFNYTESFYRKPCQEFYKMLSIYIDRIENGKEIKKLNDDKQNLVSKISILQTDYKNLKEQLINTEKTLEKLEVKSELSKINVVKQRTKQLEINKWIREHSRQELFFDEIKESIKKYLPNYIMPQKIELKQSDKKYILCFSDMHFDKEFEIYGLNNEIINKYSPEIFYQRMDLLLQQTINDVKKHNINSLDVVNLGDSLEGFLRHSILFNLRYGVIDSSILLGNYLGKWLLELSKYTRVTYHQVNGNHGELRILDGKKGAHLNENIEKVVLEIIRLINLENENFSIKQNKTGLVFFDALGYNILGIHGEEKDLSQAIKDYQEIYNTKIDYILAGHKHHASFQNCGVRKGCVGIGSLIGVDGFSMSIKKIADATATLLTFEDGKGKTNTKDYILN
jgi:hypothetical protein